MKLAKTCLAAPLALALLLSAAPARGEAVGLGIGIGAAIPIDDVTKINNVDTPLEANFGWGFFVDIPLIMSFHLTPSAMVYRINDNQVAADMGLAFKFIVTLPFVRPYAGLNVGTTVFGADQEFTVGGIGGLGINLVANLDAFVQGQYGVMVRDVEQGGNVKFAHATVGALIRFH